MAYLPTLVQLKVQRYAFKVVSRFLLGGGIVLMLGASLLCRGASLWPNLAFLATFLVLFRLTTQLRGRYVDAPCVRCPEGRFPLCAWRLPEIDDVLGEVRAGKQSPPAELVAVLDAVSSTLRSTSAEATAPCVQFESIERGA